MEFERRWEIRGLRSPREFFSALPVLVSLPVYLRLSGHSDPDVRAFLEQQEADPEADTRWGTLYRGEIAFCVLATDESLSALSELAGHHAAPEICDDLHVYSTERILLEWYDAFDGPLVVDASISEASVQKFCAGLQVEYAESQDQ